MQRGGMLLWRFSGIAQGLHETVNLSRKVAAGIASGRFQSSCLGFERRAPVLMLSPVLKVSRVTAEVITLNATTAGLAAAHATFAGPVGVRRASGRSRRCACAVGWTRGVRHARLRARCSFLSHLACCAEFRTSMAEGAGAMRRARDDDAPHGMAE